MKKPFLYASGAAVYIITLVSVGSFVGSFLENKEETIIIPITMLSLLVLSVAIMGFFFLSEPLYLLIENKKKEAIVFFAKTVGVFACFVLAFVIINLLV